MRFRFDSTSGSIKLDIAVFVIPVFYFVCCLHHGTSRSGFSTGGQRNRVTNCDREISTEMIDCAISKRVQRFKLAPIRRK